MTDWTITLNEAGAMLGLSRSVISRYLRAGKLSGYHVGRHWRVSVDSVVALMEERREQERERARFLSTAQVVKAFGLCRSLLTKHIRRGNLKTAGRGEDGCYLMEPEAVADFWQREMNGVCVRCRILGEATAEQGFMCSACEYEERTVRVYSWPICQPKSGGLRQGAMTRQRGSGRGGWESEQQ